MPWTFLQKVSYFLVAVLVLCIPAFYNGFPLMYPDTAGYILAGFTDEVGYARVWLYSGYLRHISLWESLWFVIFSQGCIVTGTLYLMFKYFFKSPVFNRFALFYILIVGTTTAVSFHVSMLMPDIFTPIVILSFCLLLFGKQLSKRDMLLTVLLFMLSTGMHNSNLILNIGLILGLAFLMLLKKTRLLLTNLGVTSKKLITLSALVFCTHILICTLHYSKGGAFKATRGGAIFLFARLCDFGIAQDYLKENCVKIEGDSLCDHIETLGFSAHFLWEEGSYLYKKGGWTNENEAYYKALVKDILTTPRYLKTYVIKSIESTFMQLFYYERSPTEQQHATRTDVVNKYFDSYAVAVKISRQARGAYTIGSIENQNAVQHLVIILSLFLSFLLLWDKQYSERHKAILLFILAALITNAFIVGATSGVYDRYQSRVVWLITLPVFWYLWTKLTAFKTLLYKDRNSEV